MNSRRGQVFASGLTLVELLATTALLGILVTVLLKTWSAPGERTKLRALVEQMKSLDARARVAARAGSPVALSLDPSLHRLIAHRRFGGELVDEVPLPADADVEFLKDGTPPRRAVYFLPCGASCDYALDLREGAAHARVEFSGLTGWATTLYTEAQP